MHAVLRNFVDSAQGLLLMKPEKLVQRARAFSNLVRLLDRFRDIRLRQDHSFAELLSARKLRQDR
jgi:hypothetical protein